MCCTQSREVVQVVQVIFPLFMSSWEMMRKMEKKRKRRRRRLVKLVRLVKVYLRCLVREHKVIGKLVVEEEEGREEEKWMWPRVVLMVKWELRCSTLDWLMMLRE